MKASKSYINSSIKLKPSEFKILSDYINGNYGIKLPITKKTLLEGRLQKRLRVLNLKTFKEYTDFVFSDNGKDEIIHMVDIVSTNKTDFFRDSSHFDYMTENILPQFQKEKRNIRIWSAASSSGEEIYTLAITIEEFNLKNKCKIDYQILGTDISTAMLKKCVDAVYPIERIKDIPYDLKRRYFLKSKDEKNAVVRVIKPLRDRATFKRLNLMDQEYKMGGQYDIIFCRNVLIYFDKQTQEQVINKLSSKLQTGGTLFLGHCESIIGLKVPVTQVKPTIYKKM